jgi:hypothetical protein
MMLDEMGEACGTYVGEGPYRVLVWWEKLKEADHFDDIGLDGNVVL